MIATGTIDRGRSVAPLWWPSAAAGSLRRRAEEFRLDAIARSCIGLVDPELIDEPSRGLVEELLAPVFAVLERAHRDDRERELAEVAVDLFDLGASSR